MPIKEIMAIGAAILGTIMFTHPTRPLEAVRGVELRILRDVGRTNNWGAPSIFRNGLKPGSR